jgi:mRNA interferase HigB
MVIVGRDKLTKAEDDHAGSGLGNALANWVKIVEGVGWKHFADVKATFGARVDLAGGFVVFDIKGNAFRITTIINYQVRTVLILRVQTHKQYTRKGA